MRGFLSPIFEVEHRGVAPPADSESRPHRSLSSLRPTHLTLACLQTDPDFAAFIITSRPPNSPRRIRPRRNFEVAFSAVSIAAETIGFVSQKVAASSHRFCFGSFRSRTPGPPPFSSISSGPRLRRAPSPPPFSSINSTPAFSRARRMADALANVIVVFPSVDSARWIVAGLTPDSRTRSAADQRRRARAALI